MLQGNIIVLILPDFSLTFTQFPDMSRFSDKWSPWLEDMKFWSAPKECRGSEQLKKKH